MTRSADRIADTWRPTPGTGPHRVLMHIAAHGGATRTSMTMVHGCVSSALRYLAHVGLIERHVPGGGWYVTDAGWLELGGRHLTDTERAELAARSPEELPARKPKAPRETRSHAERIAWESTRYADDIETQLFVAAFPDGAMLDEIGEFLGITRERVRQLESDAMRSLAKRMRLAGVSEPGDHSAITWIDQGRWT